MGERNANVKHVWIVAYQIYGSGWEMMAYEQERDAKLYALNIRQNLHVMPSITKATFIPATKSGAKSTDGK